MLTESYIADAGILMFVVGVALVVHAKTVLSEAMNLLHEVRRCNDDIASAATEIDNGRCDRARAIASEWRARAKAIRALAN